MVLDASCATVVDAAGFGILDAELGVDAGGADNIDSSLEYVDKSGRVEVVDVVLDIVNERLWMLDMCFGDVEERLAVVGACFQVLVAAIYVLDELLEGVNICVLPLVRQQRVHAPQDMHNLDGSEKCPHKCEWHNGRRKQAIAVELSNQRL